MRDHHYCPWKVWSSISSEIDNLYIERWSNEISPQPTLGRASTSKLRTYAKFKQHFSLENYLLVQKSKPVRAEFTKLRISAHKLMIESGRYHKPNKIPIEERFCMICEDGSIEDEFHFVCQCKGYNQERITFFSKISSIFPDFEGLNSDEKFICIMTCFEGDSEAALLITKFIQHCVGMRGSQLQ